MRLLVVEDSENLSHLVTAGLTKAGYDVDAYATTSDARTALERVRYAAMFSISACPTVMVARICARCANAGTPRPS